MDSITFTLPGLPTSVNSLYNVIWTLHRVELKSECRRWKQSAKGKIPHFDVPKDCLLKIDCEFHYPFLYQNGKLRKFDTSNLLKLLYDAVAEGLNVDDSRFKAGSFTSIDEEDEWVQVMVTIL